MPPKCWSFRHRRVFRWRPAELGWALQDVTCISLHGRAVAGLQAHILPQNRILSLTSNARTVHEAACLLTDRCYGASQLTVLEHIGGARQKVIRHRADAVAALEMTPSPFADFNMLAIECVAAPGAAIHPPVPGLPDDAFSHDGQLTKREVRAATLAALQPCPHALLWDVGAGCGSVAVEWMRAARGAHAVAVEGKPTRIAMIAENAAALGTPRLAIVEGRAPDALGDLDMPDAIFIGGGIAAPELFDTCWRALKPGGRLVANVVTLEGETRLADLHGTHGGALTRIAVARAEPVGAYRGFKPLMPVTQWSVQKPWATA